MTSNQSGDIGTAAVCYAICGATISGWQCSVMADRTIEVNGATVTTCGGPLTALPDGCVYISFSAGYAYYAAFSYW